MNQWTSRVARARIPVRMSCADLTLGYIHPKHIVTFRCIEFVQLNDFKHLRKCLVFCFSPACSLEGFDIWHFCGIRDNANGPDNSFMRKNSLENYFMKKNWCAQITIKLHCWLYTKYAYIVIITVSCKVLVPKGLGHCKIPWWTMFSKTNGTRFKKI